MSQPVKKVIKETHPEMVAQEPIYTLLVDGNSLLFACMADDKVNINNVHYGGIFQFLLQLRMQLQKKDFDYIYVFFDDEYSGWLRWNLYAPYKGNRDKHYQDYAVSEYMKQYNENLRRMQNYLFNKKKKKDGEPQPTKELSGWDKFIDENFDRERDILCLIFNELFIRWDMDEVVEGDDLIAYYCKNKKPNEKIVIVSGDMDLSQLIADDICIYNVREKKYMSPATFKAKFGYPHENTLVKKIFCGDTSDNIGNIKGLSESRFYELMPEAKTQPITVEEVKAKAQLMIDERVKSKKKPLQYHENIVKGISNKEYDGDFYEINEKIINLKNPLLTDEAKEEMDAMMYAPMDPEGRSFANVSQIIDNNGITDLMGDTKFATFFSPFKRLTEKEKKRYENG